MPAITSANVANAIVKLVAADALPALVGNLVMGNLVNRDYEPTLAQAGDTVNVPIAPQLVANNIAEGGAVQPQNPSLGNAQIVLNTHAEATFQIPDVTKVLAVPDLLKVYMQPAVVAIAEKIESDLLNLYAGFTANAPLGTAGTPVTEAMLDQAETALFQAKVPASEPKYLVVDSNTYSRCGRFRASANSRRPAKRVCGRMVDGTIGKIKDFFVFRSQYVPKTGSCAGEHAQPGVLQGCDRSGDSPPAAAAAGHRRHRRVRRTGQLRHARDDELPAEHAVAAVHG